MWFSEITSKADQMAKPETAVVTDSSKDGICVSGSYESRLITMFSVYGIKSLPPQGAEVLTMPIENGTIYLGTKTQPNDILPGEIKIQNQAGAYIHLKNNGEISLNGKIFSPNGEAKTS